jgi:hypothetical protein
MANNKKKTDTSKKPAPKAKVSKQNQHRVEYKDRISRINESTLTSNSGDAINGPENSLILLPSAMTDAFNQGSSNGQVEGNNINAKFLNMKVKLDFTSLPQNVFIQHNQQTLPATQRYDIYIKQVLIKQSIDEYLVGAYANPESNRSVPAFPVLADIPIHWRDTARKYLFNGRIQPNFLSYEKRMDNHIRILRSWRVLGDTTKNFRDGGDGTTESPDLNISPDKHYSFNWVMPKDKTLLSPDANGTSYALSKMWVPAVIITMNRKHTDLVNESGQAVALTPLNVNDISHFTYTDA